jgi:hypothetical protein
MMGIDAIGSNWFAIRLYLDKTWNVARASSNVMWAVAWSSIKLLNKYIQIQRDNEIVLKLVAFNSRRDLFQAC